MFKWLFKKKKVEQKKVVGSRTYPSRSSSSVSINEVIHTPVTFPDYDMSPSVYRESFSGNGGDFGGAGASGSWDSGSSYDSGSSSSSYDSGSSSCDSGGGSSGGCD